MSFGPGDLVPRPLSEGVVTLILCNATSFFFDTQVRMLLSINCLEGEKTS